MPPAPPASPVDPALDDEAAPVPEVAGSTGLDEAQAREREAAARGRVSRTGNAILHPPPGASEGRGSGARRAPTDGESSNGCIRGARARRGSRTRPARAPPS